MVSVWLSAVLLFFFNGIFMNQWDRVRVGSHTHHQKSSWWLLCQFWVGVLRRGWGQGSWRHPLEKARWRWCSDHTLAQILTNCWLWFIITHRQITVAVHTVHAGIGKEVRSHLVNISDSSAASGQPTRKQSHLPFLLPNQSQGQSKKADSTRQHRRIRAHTTRQTECKRVPAENKSALGEGSTLQRLGSGMESKISTNTCAPKKGDR